MKKSLQVFSLIIVAVAMVSVAVPANSTNAQTLIETEAATGIGATLDAQRAPNSSGIINTVKDRLRASNTQTQAQKIEDRVGNRVEEQNALRAKLLEQRASTTQFREKVKEERKELNQERVEQAQNIRQEKKAMLMEARFDAFKIRQTALVKQLNLSISNLEQIASRAADRISKAETSGRDMAQAKNLLIIAREKIAAVKITIQSVKNYTPPTITATTTSNASVSVDIVKPREVGAEAIKAVKEAKESLVAVVRAIAHAMGLENAAGTDATSSASTTNQ